MKKVNEIFDVRYGHSLELNRLTKTTSEAGIAFVSRKSGDNGIAAFVEPVPDLQPNPAGELTCALSGNGVLSTFIQPRPYYTAFHVACLRPLVPLTTAELLYYCACLRSNRFRYSWGRQANRTLKDILVPAPEDIPAWVTAADVEVCAGADKPACETGPGTLETEAWPEFQLTELFDIRKGKRLTKANWTSGGTPFVGSIEKNNGVSGRIGQSPIHDGNTITVNYNGSVAEAFYQPVPFWASDDVNVLYPKFELTPATALFIATVIRKEKYRFSYGRKWHKERMEQSTIRLPANSDGSADWEFMEAYVRSLPFSSQLQT